MPHFRIRVKKGEKTQTVKAEAPSEAKAIASLERRGYEVLWVEQVAATPSVAADVSHPDEVPPPPDSLQAGREIDAVCDAFDEAWNGEAPPSLEAVLAAHPEIDRDALLSELLRTELEVRRAKGDWPTVDEYLERLPEDEAVVRRTFDFAETVVAPLEPHAETVTGPPTQRTERLEPTGTLGDYEIVERIGKGGMGLVYKARQKSLNRLVALKTIRSGDLAEDAEEVKRFRSEAEAAAALVHPHIVPVYEFGEADGQWYFSMELVEGGTLADRLKEGPLEPRRAAELLRPVAEAVAHAHELGVVHRDLKPGNVMLTADGTPKVADFGLAKRIETESGMTATGQVLGTPAYMPPEQARGENVGPLADVYSLGAILYCLLTGRPPFQAANVMETLQQVLDRDPVPPRQLNPAVPRDLETITLKCLEKDPGQRYESTAALLADLEQFLDGKPIAARPVGRLEHAWRWCRRHSTLAASLATTLVALLAGMIVSTSFYLEADHQRTMERRRADSEADARSAEAEAKREAQRLQGVAELNESNALKNLYRARLAPIQRAWEDRQLAQLTRLLRECEPAKGQLDQRGWEWSFLRAQCDRTFRLIRSASEYTGEMAWLQDRRQLAVATRDGRIDIWDMERELLVHQLHPDIGRIASLAWAPAGTQLAIASADGGLYVVDVEDGRSVFTTDTQDTHDTQLVVTELAWSAEGSFLAMGLASGVTHVWDTSRWEERMRIPSPQAEQSDWHVLSLDWHGEYVAIGYRYGHAAVWDVRSTKKRFSRHCFTSSWVRDVAWSPNGRILATAASTDHHLEPNVVLWGRDGTEHHRIYLPQTKAVLSLAWADQDRLVCATSAGSLAVVDSRTGVTLDILPAVATQGANLAIDHSTSHSLSTTSSGIIAQSLSPFAQDWTKRTRVPGHLISDVSFSPDSQRIAVSTTGRDVHILDAITLATVDSVRLAAEPIAIDWDPTGQLLAIYHRQTPDGHILSLWNGASTALAEVLSPVAQAGRSRRAVCFNPAGDKIAVASTTGVQVYDVTTRTCNTLAGSDNALTVSWSKHGIVAQVAGELGPEQAQLMVWRSDRSKEPAAVAPCGPFRARCAEWNQRDGRVAMGTEKGTVHLWSPFSSAPPTDGMPLHQEATRLVWSADGERVATAGLGGFLRIWDGHEVVPLVALRLPHGISALDWSRDGSSIVCGGEDGEIYLLSTSASAFSEPPLTTETEEASAEGALVRQGLRFDGKDDFAIVENFRPADTTPLTVEAWVVPRRQVSTLPAVVSNAEGSGMSLEQFRGAWAFCVASRGGWVRAVQPRRVDEGRRCHIAGVFTGSRVLLFVDGRAVSAVDIEAPVVASPMEFVIGANPSTEGAPNECFVGTIEQVRISRGVRYKGNFRPVPLLETDRETEVLYRFEEVEGRVATDHSGNGNAASVNGAKWVRRPEVAATGERGVIGGELGREFVWMRPSTYQMGSPRTEVGRDDDETPVSVTLSQGIWIQRTEVTRGLWREVMASEPWKENPRALPSGDDYAATHVSWEDASLFCRRLTEREQTAARLSSAWQFRLPTEAEWECACRAGTRTAFCYGNDTRRLGQYAWYETTGLRGGQAFANVVGRLKPNAWGLHDMHGNVCEWCLDAYSKTLPGGEDPVVAHGSQKVCRGGAWGWPADGIRSADRFSKPPASKTEDLGFRMVVVPRVGTELEIRERKVSRVAEEESSSQPKLHEVVERDGMAVVRLKTEAADQIRLSLSHEGLVVREQAYGHCVMDVNGVSWDTKARTTLPNAGETQFLPDWADLDRAVVTLERKGKWGDFRYRSEDGGLSLELIDEPAGESPYDIVIRAPRKSDGPTKSLEWYGEWETRSYPFESGEMQNGRGPDVSQLEKMRPQAPFELSDLDLRWWKRPPKGHADVPTERVVLLANRSFSGPAGTYRITTMADDGIRVLVDGEPVIDRWTANSPRFDAGEVELAGGVHKVRVEYFQGTSLATLAVNVQRLADENPGDRE